MAELSTRIRPRARNDASSRGTKPSVIYRRYNFGRSNVILTGGREGGDRTSVCMQILIADNSAIPVRLPATPCNLDDCAREDFTFPVFRPRSLRN